MESTLKEQAVEITELRQELNQLKNDCRDMIEFVDERKAPRGHSANITLSVPFCSVSRIRNILNK
jgi:hypothetical protein